MLLLLQPFRSAESTDAAQTLEELLSRPDPEIDGLAHAIGTRWRLMRITVSSRSPMAYPSAGYFPLLGEPTSGNCPFGLAIPLNETHAFVGVPSDVQPAQTEFWTSNGAGFVANYSVGHRSQVVVVHPSVVKSLPEVEIVKAIRDVRAGVFRAIELCGQTASVLQKIDALV